MRLRSALFHELTVRWSLRIARVAGIGIYVHATFLMLLAWVGLDGYRQGGTRGALGAVLFIIVIMAIVAMSKKSSTSVETRRTI